MQNPPIRQHNKSSVHEAYVQYHQLMFKSYHSPILKNPSRYKKCHPNSQKINASKFHNLSHSKDELVEFNSLSMSSIHARTQMSSMVKQSYFHESINEKHNSINEILNYKELDFSQLDLKKKKPNLKDQFLSTEPILSNLNESLDTKLETIKTHQKLILDQALKNQTKSQLIVPKKQTQQVLLEQQSQKLNQAKHEINLSSITEKKSSDFSPSENNRSQSSSNCNVKSKILNSKLFDTEDNQSQSIASSASETIKDTSKEIVKLKDNYSEENDILLQRNSQANSQKKRKESSCDSYEKKRSSSSSSQEEDYKQRITSIKHTQSQTNQTQKQVFFALKKPQQVHKPFQSIQNNQTLNDKKTKIIESSLGKVQKQKNVIEQLLKDTLLTKNITQNRQQTKNLKKQSDSDDDSEDNFDYDSKISNQKSQSKVQQKQSTQPVISLTIEKLQKPLVKKSNMHQDSDQQWTQSHREEEQKLNQNHFSTNNQSNKYQTQNLRSTLKPIIQNIHPQQIGQKENHQDKAFIEQQKRTHQKQNISKKPQDKRPLQKSSYSSEGSSDNQDYDTKIRQKSVAEIKQESESMKRKQQNIKSYVQNESQSCDDRGIIKVERQQQMLQARQQQQANNISQGDLQYIHTSKVEKNINEQHNQFEPSSSMRQHDTLVSAQSLVEILTSTIVPNLASSIISNLGESLKSQISKQIKAHNELLYYQLKDCLMEEINQKFKSLHHFIANQRKTTNKNSQEMLLKEQNENENEEITNKKQVQIQQKEQYMNRNQPQLIIRTEQQENQIQVGQNLNKSFTQSQQNKWQNHPFDVEENLQQNTHLHKQNLVSIDSPHQQQTNTIQLQPQPKICVDQQTICANKPIISAQQQPLQLIKLKDQLQQMLKTQISKEIKSTIRNQVREVFKEEITPLIKHQIKEGIQQQLSHFLSKSNDLSYQQQPKSHQYQNQLHSFINQVDKQIVNPNSINNQINQQMPKLQNLHHQNHRSRLNLNQQKTLNYHQKDSVQQESQSRLQLQSQLESRSQINGMSQFCNMSKSQLPADHKEQKSANNNQGESIKCQTIQEERSYSFPYQNKLSQAQFHAPHKDSIESYEQEWQAQDDSHHDKCHENESFMRKNKPHMNEDQMSKNDDNSVSNHNDQDHLGSNQPFQQNHCEDSQAYTYQPSEKSDQ